MKKNKKIIYLSFDRWLVKELKKPGFRAVYEEQRTLVDIAFTLEHFRKQRGLTQRALAKRVGIKPEALSRIESGTHNMTLDTLVKVAGVLGKKVELV